MVAARRFALGGTDVTLVPVQRQGHQRRGDRRGQAARRPRRGRDRRRDRRSARRRRADRGRGRLDPRPAPLRPGRRWGRGPGLVHRTPAARPATSAWSRPWPDASSTHPSSSTRAVGRSPAWPRARSRRTRPAPTPPRSLQRLARRQRQLDTAVDSVVVSGPPELQAPVVAALQGSGIDVPRAAHRPGAQPRLRRRRRPGRGLALRAAAVRRPGRRRRHGARVQRGRARAGGVLLRPAAERRRPGREGPVRRPAVRRGGRAPPTSPATTPSSPWCAPRRSPAAPIRPRSPRPSPGLRLGVGDGLAGPRLDFSSTVATVRRRRRHPRGDERVAGGAARVATRRRSTGSRAPTPEPAPAVPVTRDPQTPYGGRATSEEQTPCTW